MIDALPRVLKLEVPGRPITGNLTFRFTRKGQRYTSAEAIEYRKRVHNIAFSQAARIRWKAPKECTVNIVAFNARGDIDGLAKNVLDALQGAAIQDDRYITRLVIEKRTDTNGPRLEIEVEA